ncbi:hypothetical protein ERJ75_000573600 [Trypanosoma vivax]|nr:hypothetical protein ERJ75_000573600 [Trypanosoma vivax]
MCGPALPSLLAVALSLALRSEKALAASTDGLASGVAQKMCAFGTALDNAAGEARAVTAKLALRRETAGRNLGALTAALECSAAILNSSTEAATLRSHAEATLMAQRARDANEELTSIMEATMTPGDAASKAAAGVKEYMRVVGTVAGTNSGAVTCLDTAASLTPGITAVQSKLGTECKHFFGAAPETRPQGFAEVIKALTKQGKDTIITGTSAGITGNSGATRTRNFGRAADTPNNT